MLTLRLNKFQSKIKNSFLPFWMTLINYLLSYFVRCLLLLHTKKYIITYLVYNYYKYNLRVLRDLLKLFRQYNIDKVNYHSISQIIWTLKTLRVVIVYENGLKMVMSMVWGLWPWDLGRTILRTCPHEEKSVAWSESPSTKFTTTANAINKSCVLKMPISFVTYSVWGIWKYFFNSASKISFPCYWQEVYNIRT